MQALKFDIRHPDGRTEEVRLDSDRAMIGSGAHCEIRLGIDQAGVESVAIQLTAAGIFADARSFQPPPTINGSPFTRTQIAPGSVLGVGYTQIVASVVEVAGTEGAAQKPEQKTSPLTLLMALIVMPLALYIIFQDPPNDGVGKAPHEVPELWGPPATQCPQSAPQAAMAKGLEQFTKAASKQERRPFYVPDGVQAVPLYEEAAVCFQAGGDAERAKRASSMAAKLRVDVGEDFRMHRVRLEHSLSTQRYETAQKEVRVLLAFLQGKEGEYVEYLSVIERKLRIKYGDQSRQKKSP
ncbi:MAG: hypothetical protein IPI67_20025 [Myxococcales bacterium]|nr:hypothetical protein [Myxococcales bacterium]